MTLSLISPPPFPASEALSSISAFSHIMLSNCDAREQPPHPPLSPSSDMSATCLPPSSPVFSMPPTTGSFQATIPIYQPHPTNANPWPPHNYGFGFSQMDGVQAGGYPVVHQPGGFVLISYLTNLRSLTNFFKNPVAKQGYNVNPVITGLNSGSQYTPTQPGSTAQHP